MSDSTNPPSGNTQNQQTFDQLAPEVWDRFGAYFSYASGVAAAISKRSVRTWNEVSGHLRSGATYGADTMASDSALLMVTALDNAQDLWTLWTAPPEGRTLAGLVPTVLLVFDYVTETDSHTVPDPVFIVPPADIDPLPGVVRIVLEGQDADAAANIRAALTVTREARGRVYKLEPTATNDPPTPGTYNGFVFIQTGGRDVALADLRVVVDGPPTGLRGVRR